jgi:hypothetical protein
VKSPLRSCSKIYLERIARLDSQLRCYRMVLTDKPHNEAYAGPIQRRIVWTPVSGCRCSACRSRSKTMSTSPSRRGTAEVPFRIGAYQRRGAVSTLLLVAQRVPYFPVCNVTGQPAARSCRGTSTATRCQSRCSSSAARSTKRRCCRCLHRWKPHDRGPTGDRRCHDWEIACQAASLAPGRMTCAGLVDGSRW